MPVSSKSDTAARDEISRAPHVGRIGWQRPLYLLVLIAILLGIFFLMWLLSPRYPRDLSNFRGAAPPMAEDTFNAPPADSSA